jgi:nicotinate-nucleotide adenylyltransferase
MRKPIVKNTAFSGWHYPVTQRLSVPLLGRECAMRLGIFGGTFDPIHNAHLEVARAAAASLQLEKVLLIPAGAPPHKAGITHAPYADRVRMAELACAEDPLFEVSRLEEGARRSYSILTIEKLRAGLTAADKLFFIIGADAFAEITTWFRWEDVARVVEFIVAGRPGHQYSIPPGFTVHPMDALDLPASSSAVRAALASGERPAEVPPPVLEYILAHGLYGAKKL